MKYHILLINLITFTLASTPFYYGFSFSNGYDNNVLRLSSSEVKEINSNMTFIDGIDKLDSYISKFGFKVDKKIDDHVDACTSRYEAIDKRLYRIEAILIGASVSVIGLLLKIIIG